QGPHRAPEGAQARPPQPPGPAATGRPAQAADGIPAEDRRRAVPQAPRPARTSTLTDRGAARAAPLSSNRTGARQQERIGAPVLGSGFRAARDRRPGPGASIEDRPPDGSPLSRRP